MTKRLTVGRIVVSLVVVVVVLYIVATYVAFMRYTEAATAQGVWEIRFQSAFEVTPITVRILSPSITVEYDKSPELPDYSDWLFSRFRASDATKDRDKDSVVYSIRLTVSTVVNERIKRTITEMTYYIHLDDLGTTTLLSLNKTFGPYIAYNSSLPMKAQFVLEVSDFSGVVQTSVGAYYVTQWK